MNKPLLNTVLALMLAVVICETILIRKNAGTLTRAEVRASELRAEITRLKILITETSIPASEPPETRTPISSDDDASVVTLRTLHSRVRNLQHLFELLPEEQIPELRLLSESDWISVVIERDLTTASEFSTALGYARNRARRKLVLPIQAAFKKYLAASNNLLPETPLALLPCFDPPIDPAILARHEMILSGSTIGLEPRTSVMREKNSIANGPADNLAEIGLTFTKSVPAQPHATHRIKPEILTALAEATLAFRRDHHGKDAATFEQLRPYLKNPAEAARAVYELTPSAR